mmetsp:Transcript_19965/g.27720  ORF Transcript_19965/g.27720 Transcript_19965/m.27720 type:complete len:313 (-) Transcript_19965:198-1136(-)
MSGNDSSNRSSSTTTTCINDTAATGSVLEKLNFIDEGSTKEEVRQQSELLLIECETNGSVFASSALSKQTHPIQEISFDTEAGFDENLDQHRLSYSAKYKKNKNSEEKKIELQWPHHYTSRHRSSNHPRQQRRWSTSMAPVEEHSSSFYNNPVQTSAEVAPPLPLLIKSQSQSQEQLRLSSNNDQAAGDIVSEQSQHQKQKQMSDSTSFDVNGYLKDTTATTFLHNSCDTLDYETSGGVGRTDSTTSTTKRTPKTLPTTQTRTLRSMSISSLFGKGSSSKQTKKKALFKVHQTPPSSFRPSFELGQGWHAGL